MSRKPIEKTLEHEPGQFATITGDDPVDAILHRLNAVVPLFEQRFDAIDKRVEALAPAMQQIAKGVAEEKNIALIATLNNVHQLLSAIEQLPNEKSHERGPIAREAMGMIDRVLS